METLVYQTSYIENTYYQFGFNHFFPLVGHPVTEEVHVAGTVVPNFLDFLQNKNLKAKERIKMCYSEAALKILGKSFAKKGFKIGLGCIATGIYGDEKTISPEKLGKEISRAKAYNANEVIIFRLGGLNEEYISEIKKVYIPEKH